jgi:DNA-directed RNA polymerase specialized sigma24 family protein
MARLHHERLRPAARDDISLYRGALSEEASVSLAAHLLGAGSEDREAARAEQKLLLQEVLKAIDPLDRNALTLRHCKQLANHEAATALGIRSSQAREVYIRAL